MAVNMPFPTNAKITALVCKGLSRPNDSHDIPFVMVGQISSIAIVRPTSMPTSPHKTVAIINNLAILLS
jgi:hypothetical protein